MIPFRNQNMYVTTEEGRIEYVAASPFVISTEIEKLYYDIDILLKQNLDIQSVFYSPA